MKSKLTKTQLVQLILSICSFLGVGAATILGWLDPFFQWIQTHTDIFLLLIIILIIVLGSIYTERIKQKARNEINQLKQTIKDLQSNTTETKYFTIDKFKWEVSIKNNKFSVYEIPLCAKHNLRLIENGKMYACPDFNKTRCTTFLFIDEHRNIYDKAYSYIEKQIKPPK